MTSEIEELSKKTNDFGQNSTLQLDKIKELNEHIKDLSAINGEFQMKNQKLTKSLVESKSL